ncbi:MAG: phenylalanine--tRNA ligase subunit beta [Candidatus Woesearchaeota archaeon]
MPNIVIDKQDLLKLIGRQLSDEKLKDRISMLGTDLEKVGKEVEVEVFPNRPDMLSVEGFSRALKSFIGVKKGLKDYKVLKGNYVAKIDKKVSKVRPYAVATVVKNVKLDDEILKSLMQVQEKLHMTHGRNREKVSIGVYDLDKIKFPITFTTKPVSFKFTPLEYSDRMNLNQILNKHPKGKEYAQLLEKFEEYPIWIDSKKQVLSMPPIINSQETRVHKKTKNLFIDVTGWDLNAVEQALNIVVCSLADRNGKIYSVNVDGKSYPDLKPVRMKVNRDYVNKILGLDLNEVKIKELLSMMGIGYGNGFALVPAYRADVLSEIDLVEDIAIAYGYENFEAEIPNVATIAAEDLFEKFKSKVANILVGYGLLETNTYNLTNKENQTSKMGINLDLVEIENALNKEYNVLRGWMIPSLLEVLGNNKHHMYPQNIFEIGTVFSNDEEKDRLAILLCPGNYTDARQILDGLFRALDLDYKVRAVEHKSFIDGRVGRVSVKGKDVAYIGEIHPRCLSSFDLKNPVVGFELNLSGLFKLI